MAPDEPSRAVAAIDTTDDPELEARWQALVQEVIDAKETFEATREQLHEAQAVAGLAARQRRPLTAEEAERLNAAAAARADAADRLERAQAAMKAGEI